MRKSIPIRDRVRELRRIPASQLKANPLNWRTHPDRQRRLLEGILGEIGYADALIARELPDGTLELLDGHLRAETTPEAEIPVLIVDLNDDESRKLLAVLDPLSALAEQDDETLRLLTAPLEFKDPLLREFLESQFSLPLPDEEPDLLIPESFQVAVECVDEASQRALYDRLTGEGYPCRLMML